MNHQLDLFAAPTPEIKDAQQTISSSVQSEEGSENPIPNLTDGLNPEQAQAVLTDLETPLQVLAGAGTGKTELISRRFIHLCNLLSERGVEDPSNRILVVTFTNDAAQGMRERIHNQLLKNGLPGLSADAWIGTFHQTCLRILRAQSLRVGLPTDFNVLNPLNQRLLLNRLVEGVLHGEYADLTPWLQNAELKGQLSPDVLSHARLSSLQTDDVEKLLSPELVYSLINRIKTSGLSPREFLETATSQAQQLTDALKDLPMPHDSKLKAPENMVQKILAWQVSLKPWSAQEWQPVQQAEAKAEEKGKTATASTYKDEVADLARFYLAPKTFEPTFPDVQPLADAFNQEVQLAQIIAAIYLIYQATLRQQGVCDFDDLINHTIQILNQDDPLRSRYQSAFDAVIVDEFQDSNNSQLRLLSLLQAPEQKCLTVVGDEKQSIYGFRFAQPENLSLIFEDHPYQQLTLKTNYRSRPAILSVANRLTEMMTGNSKQALQPCERQAKESLPLVTWLNLNGTEDSEAGKPKSKPIEIQKALEAHFISVEIKHLLAQGQYQLGDMVVLVKSHQKAELIQQTLRRFKIPSIKQKNLGFFEEPMIKDAMAFLRLLCNPHQDLPLIRVLQRKLNQRQLMTLSQLQKRWGSSEKHHGISLFQTCLILGQTPELAADVAEGELPSQVKQAVADLAKRLQKWHWQKNRLSATRLFTQVSQQLGLRQRDPSHEDTPQALSNLKTFEALLLWCERSEGIRPTLEEILHILEQYAADPNQELPITENFDLQTTDAVRIMTVYASKGLEFPVVFLVYTDTESTRSGGAGAILFDPQYSGKAGFGLLLGKINGADQLKKFVHQKTWAAPRAKKEAQRVFYVGLTRAMEKLYVIRSEHSADWTAPEYYPRAAIEVLREAEDAEFLETHYWQTTEQAFQENAIPLPL